MRIGKPTPCQGHYCRMNSLARTSQGAVRIPEGERLDALDGLRGVAVLLVMFYHFFSHHAVPNKPVTLYQHGNLLEYAPWTAYLGMLGVQIFFVISGFVIMLTLERSSGIVDFTGRRVARLWPTMLFCATLSTLILNFSGMPEFYPGLEPWRVSIGEYLSSIFFISPKLVASVLGFDGDWRWVEGVYWTLWSEVRFYALIAIVYLISPRHRFLWAWAGIQTISTGLEIAKIIPGYGYVGGEFPNLLFQPRLLAWFSLGLCFFMLWSKRSTPVVWIIIAVSLMGVAANEIIRTENARLVFGPRAPANTVTLVLVLLPFVLFLRQSPILRFLRLRFVVTVGLASYPLYLFHELPGLTGMMIGQKIGLPPLLAVTLTATALITFAVLVHRFVETPAKNWATALWRKYLLPIQKKSKFLTF